MSRRVVLHIGTMKTGTSFLQSVLGHDKAQLRAHGTEFLGGFAIQTRAVRDLLRRPDDGVLDTARWDRLAARARASDAEVCLVSMEFLAFADAARIAAVVAPLQGLEVRVLLTVRDQFRIIPAQWQSYCRNVGVDAWADYLRRIEPTDRRADRRSRAHRSFHRAQDVDTILARWAAEPGVAGIDVVTVPPAGAPREELWTRFAAAVGVDPSVVTIEDTRDNESLGYASCDYLRRANPLLADLDGKRYRTLTRPVARRVLAPLRADEGRPVLDRRAAGLARARNQRLREVLTDEGHHLVGSLEDLPLPDDLEAWPESVEPPAPADVLRCATAVWDHAAERAGVAASARPDRLDALVADAVRLLREHQDPDLSVT